MSLTATEDDADRLVLEKLRELQRDVEDVRRELARYSAKVRRALLEAD